MADFLGTYCIATHQQVGDFIVQNVNGKVKKQGGNVASYFCTPDGRVIHAVLGPVKAEVLVDEGRWAVTAFEAVDDRTPRRQALELATAHRNAVQQRRSGAQRKVHELLASNPLPPLKDVYQEVFTRLLRQRLSDDSVVQKAVEGIRRAREIGSPLLFIFHRQRNAAAADPWQRLVSRRAQDPHDPFAHFARRHVVVTLEQDDMPALSRHLSSARFKAPNAGSPLFVVARSTGEQIGAVTTWLRAPQLVDHMAQGLVAEAAARRSLGQLYVLAHCPNRPMQLAATKALIHVGAGRIFANEELDPYDWDTWHRRYRYAGELSHEEKAHVLASFAAEKQGIRWAVVNRARLHGWYEPGRLIDAVGDEDSEVRAEARLALKRLSGEDHGPPGPEPSAEQIAASQAGWRKWKVGQEFVKEYARKKSADVVANFTHEDSTERWGAIHVARKRRLHVPDELIARLTDEEGLVRREAHMALKQLAPGKNFGPTGEEDATAEGRNAAAERWREHFAQRREKQAQNALELAQKVYFAGNDEIGRGRFRDVVKKFPGTKAAKKAEEWLASPR